MSSHTNTIKHTDIRAPSIRDASHWVEKLLSSEKVTDGALLTMVALLLGWLVYCLSRAFASVQFLP